MKNSTILLSLPSIGSLNLGDYIIEEAIRDQIHKLFPDRRLFYSSMHQPRSYSSKKAEELSKIRFLCGTNALGVYPLKRPHFHHRIDDFWSAFRKYTLFGVGWRSESQGSILIEKILYNNFLCSESYHSVRDSQAEKRLNDIGIKKVINTCCPTTWDISIESIEKIPKKKKNSVVLTLTDYSKSKSDLDLLKLAIKNYKKVYFWPQGAYDKEYFLSLLPDIKNLTKNIEITILPETLLSYKTLLSEGGVDYLGTRLHAAILALKFSTRIMLISVDNRAKSLCSDIGLIYFSRGDIDKLNDFLNSNDPISFTLPYQAIQDWKEYIISRV